VAVVKLGPGSYVAVTGGPAAAAAAATALAMSYFLEAATTFVLASI